MPLGVAEDEVGVIEVVAGVDANPRTSVSTVDLDPESVSLAYSRGVALWSTAIVCSSPVQFPTLLQQGGAICSREPVVRSYGR
jgi:hypothetical protein